MRCNIFLILLLVGIIAAAVRADQFEVMSYYAKAGPARCYPNGQIILPFAQFKGNTPVPGFIKEIAIKTGTDTYQSIKGSYYNKDYKPITVSAVGETVLFVSEEYIFNENKNYTVIMSGVPYELINLYTDVTILTYQFHCPGYLHSCRFVNLKIDNCTLDKEYITVDFHGLGLLNFSGVNVVRDVVFTLSQEAYPTEADKISLPVTTEYFKTGNDSFQLRIPREDVDSTVSSVTAVVKDCSENLYKIKDTRKCVLKRTKNMTVFAHSEVEYECKPKQNETRAEAENICSRVVMLTPEKPPEPPKKLTLLFDFLRRIVHFALTISKLGK